MKPVAMATSEINGTPCCDQRRLVITNPGVIGDIRGTCKTLSIAADGCFIFAMRGDR